MVKYSTITANHNKIVTHCIYKSAKDLKRGMDTSKTVVEWLLAVFQNIN